MSNYENFAQILDRGALHSDLPLVYATDIGDGCIVVPQVVEDVFTEGGFSVVYGESNSGKSYLMSHLSVCLPQGLPWLGQRTLPGAVVYVAGEGAASIKMRVAAYKRHAGVANFPLAIVPTAINLLDPEADTARLIDAVMRAQDKLDCLVSLVIVDTLARSFGGGNENSGEDMGRVIANADRVRRDTGAHFTFVHHSGKDASKGSRGHSSLRAATDTEVEVTKDEATKIHTAEITKQRDLGSLGKRIAGRLLPLTFGMDQWCKDLTVCVVEDATAPPKPSKAKVLGKVETAIVALLRQRGAPMTKAEIARALAPSDAAEGLSPQSVYNAMNRLCKNEICGMAVGMVTLNVRT